MKKSMFVVLILCLASLFTACQKWELPINVAGNPIGSTTTGPATDSKESGKSEKDIMEPTIEWPNAALAEQCVQSVIGSGSEEQAASWLTEDSKEQAGELVSSYQGRSVSVSAKYMTHFQDYDIFFFESIDDATGEHFSEGYGLFYRSDDQYLLCANPDAQAAVLENFGCSHCHGAGSTFADNWVTCGICGGTGVQYYPNVYFDPVLNMMMGQTMACSGCGGAGRFNHATTNVCTHCLGKGLCFS